MCQAYCETHAWTAGVNKKEVLRNVLEKHSCALVHIASQHGAVVLPPSQKNQLTVTLQVGYEFAGSFSISEEEVKADMLFQGERFTVVLPFTAMWAISTPHQHHTIWPQDAPHPALAGMLIGSFEAPAAPTKEPPSQRSTPSSATKLKRSGAGHLTRVK